MIRARVESNRAGSLLGTDMKVICVAVRVLRRELDVFLGQFAVREEIVRVVFVLPSAASLSSRDPCVYEGMPVRNSHKFRFRCIDNDLSAEQYANAFGRIFDVSFGEGRSH